MSCNLSGCLLSPVHSGYSILQRGVTYGMNISERLTVCKLVSKSSITALKVAEKASDYFSELALIPFGILYPPLKDIKMVCEFFMGFRSFDFYLNKGAKGSWEIQALNIAGLSLFIFTVIKMLDRFKFDVSFIYNAAKKVPVFGILPFAGLLDLTLLTMFGALFFMGMNKKGRLEKAEARISKKQIHWQWLKGETPDNKLAQIQCKLANCKTKKSKLKPNECEKHDIKIKSWEDLSTCQDQEKINDFIDRKVEKWTKKFGECELEKKSNRLLLIKSIVKISSILIVSLALLSGAGIGVALTIALGASVVEAACEIKNYFLKRQISQYKFDSVLFESQ